MEYLSSCLLLPLRACESLTATANLKRLALFQHEEEQPEMMRDRDYNLSIQDPEAEGYPEIGGQPGLQCKILSKEEKEEEEEEKEGRMRKRGKNGRETAGGRERGRKEGREEKGREAEKHGLGLFTSVTRMITGRANELINQKSTPMYSLE